MVTTRIIIDKKGNIFIIEEAGLIYQFDHSGSYLGRITIPDFEDKINDIAVDSNGNLLVCTNKGIAFFSTQQRYSKEKGVYYTKTLDCKILNIGEEELQWRRLALEAEIPPKSIIEVYYYSDEDSQRKENVDKKMSDQNIPIQEKIATIEDLIPKWSEPPEVFGPEIPNKSKKEKADTTDQKSSSKTERTKLNMLFKEKTKRYLWLKIVLSTFDESVRPAITQIKVYYPRISYLRYLPAIYQEDASSRDFLERFLSIFETVFYDLESEISHIFKYFDPDTAPQKPQDFLTWLASWLNLALEEDWEEDKKRKFIREAYILYRLKGTPEGIRKLIEIYTGKRASILEHSRLVKPLVLRGKAGSFKLGVNTILMQTPVRGPLLGSDIIVGRVALLDKAQSIEDPFLQMAHRFTVILDLSTDEIALFEKGLRRIIDEEKPAHTIYNFRIAREMRMGEDMYIGVNARIPEYKPISLGDKAIIGSSIVVRDKETRC